MYINQKNYIQSKKYTLAIYYPYWSHHVYKLDEYEYDDISVTLNDEVP